MSTSPPSDPVAETLLYYEQNAARYAGDTAHIDMAPLYEPFLALVPAGGRILDAGCGPGRDGLAFMARGYEVLAIDGASAMVRAAAAAGVPARRLRFQEMAFESEFDGAWACASLLHVPRAEIVDVLGRLARAVRDGGCVYLSFKQGAGERWRSGRLFNDYTKEEVRRLIAGAAGLGLVSLWETADRRPHRSDEVWVNALAQRVT
jgi:SAM-dependent methyltransferase